MMVTEREVDNRIRDSLDTQRGVGVLWRIGPQEVSPYEHCACCIDRQVGPAACLHFDDLMLSWEQKALRLLGDVLLSLACNIHCTD